MSDVHARYVVTLIVDVNVDALRRAHPALYAHGQDASVILGMHIEDEARIPHVSIVGSKVERSKL